MPRLLNNTISAVHRASVIIKKKRENKFRNFSTRHLTAGRSVWRKHWGKTWCRQRYSKWLWRKKSRLTRSIVIKLPVNQDFQVTEVELCAGHCWRLSSLNLQGLMVMTKEKFLIFADWSSFQPCRWNISLQIRFERSFARHSLRYPWQISPWPPYLFFQTNVIAVSLWMKHVIRRGLLKLQIAQK